VPFFLIAGTASQKLWTILIAMIPLAELRGSIPMAIGKFHMGWEEALILSLIGNFIPVIPLLIFLESYSHRLMKYPFWNRILTWLFNRAKRKGESIEHSDASLDRLMEHRVWNRVLGRTIDRMGGRQNVVEFFKSIALALFVGVPLPLTGAWSGCVAAFIFRIPFRFSIPAIAAGIVIAGVLVTLAVLGIINAQVFIGHFGKQ
jgi:uncharacterized membrane protein